MNKYIKEFKENVNKILKEERIFSKKDLENMYNNYEDFDRDEIFGRSEKDVIEQNKLKKINIINKKPDKIYYSQDISNTDYTKILSYMTNALNRSNKCIDIDAWEIENVDDRGYEYVGQYQASYDIYEEDKNLIDYEYIKNYYITRTYELYYNKDNKRFPYKIIQQDFIMIECPDDSEINLESEPIVNYFSSDLFNDIKARLGKRIK